MKGIYHGKKMTIKYQISQEIHLDKILYKVSTDYGWFVCAQEDLINLFSDVEEDLTDIERDPPEINISHNIIRFPK